VQRLYEAPAARATGGRLPRASADARPVAVRAAAVDGRGDAAAAASPDEAFIRTHWTRIIYFDVFSGRMSEDAQGDEATTAATPATPLAESPSRAREDAAATAAGDTAQGARPYRLGIPYKAYSILVGIPVVAYLLIVVAMHLVTPEIAAATGAKQQVPVARMRPVLHAASGTGPVLLPRALRESDDTGDASRECRANGSRDSSCTYL